MKRPTEKGENVKKTVEFLKLAPRRVIMTVLSAAVIIVHLLTRSDHELNVLLTERLVRPAHRFLSVTASRVPFSVAEVLVGLFVLWVVVYLISQIVLLIREGQRIRRLLLLMLTVLCVGLTIYAAFCVVQFTL